MHHEHDPTGHIPGIDLRSSACWAPVSAPPSSYGKERAIPQQQRRFKRPMPFKTGFLSGLSASGLGCSAGRRMLVEFHSLSEAGRESKPQLRPSFAAHDPGLAGLTSSRPPGNDRVKESVAH
jgi:hypothetical protein